MFEYATRVTATHVLPGRGEALPLENQHYVNGNLLKGPFPDHLHSAIFGPDCFGGAEIVPAVFDPAHINNDKWLHVFWDSRAPAQGLRQGNDIGPQYRSVIQYASSEQEQAARLSLQNYQQAPNAAGRDAITTVIEPSTPFFYAEDDHQQYLAKNPAGYCSIDGTGVTCPV